MDQLADSRKKRLEEAARRARARKRKTSIVDLSDPSSVDSLADVESSDPISEFDFTRDSKSVYSVREKRQLRLQTVIDHDDDDCVVLDDVSEGDPFPDVVNLTDSPVRPRRKRQRKRSTVSSEKSAFDFDFQLSPRTSRPFGDVSNQSHKRSRPTQKNDGLAKSLDELMEEDPSAMGYFHQTKPTTKSGQPFDMDYSLPSKEIPGNNTFHSSKSKPTSKTYSGYQRGRGRGRGRKLSRSSSARNGKSGTRKVFDGGYIPKVAASRKSKYSIVDAEPDIPRGMFDSFNGTGLWR